jgi:membrane protein
MKSIKKLWLLLKDTGNSWLENKVPQLAAALAYYTIFSLAPLLIIVIAVAGLVFGADAARNGLVGQIQSLVGQKGAQAIQTIIAGASRPETGVIATVIGVIVLIIGATGVFTQLQDSLNTIWGVKPRPGQSILYLLRSRLLSFGLILGIGFLLLVSLTISAALAAFGDFLRGIILGFTPLLHIVNFLISFGVISVLFAMLFKFLPDAEVAWGDVWMGAVLTAFFFTIGKLLIGLYLGKSSLVSSFGAVSSIIIVLVWIYYSAQILYFGAEFTKVYANRYGSHIKPAAHAVPLTDTDRARQGISESASDKTGEKSYEK